MSDDEGGTLIHLPWGVPVPPGVDPRGDDPSGAKAAAAAYDAGAVEPRPEPLPTFDVTLSFPLTGSREQTRDFVALLAYTITGLEQAGVVAVSIVERQA